MKITEVVRGADLITSTFRQLLLYHTRADFFRPNATSTLWRIAGHDRESRCCRNFASGRHDAGHGRNVAGNDNRERCSGRKHHSIHRGTRDRV